MMMLLRSDWSNKKEEVPGNSSHDAAGSTDKDEVVVQNYK
jgi:hypothetical protein